MSTTSWLRSSSAYASTASSFGGAYMCLRAARPPDLQLRLGSGLGRAHPSRVGATEPAAAPERMCRHAGLAMRPLWPPAPHAPAGASGSATRPTGARWRRRTPCGPNQSLLPHAALPQRAPVPCSPARLQACVIAEWHSHTSLMAASAITVSTAEHTAEHTAQHVYRPEGAALRHAPPPAAARVRARVGPWSAARWTAFSTMG
jgi:hypothetical protein